ncbi:MAG TPA: rRNA maturation RNase YbeY [Myxococcota bacterium]|nr:rRNA maturation RNase YbeY [Myxococcota bacterium]
MIVRLAGPLRRRGSPPVDKRLLRRRARRILEMLGCDDAELSICLVEDVAMTALNAAHRGRRRPTDVLSFSLLEGSHARFRGRLLGDVVIGIETAARQAHARRRDLDHEVARLLIHGVLHLLGHDHVRPSEARQMRAEERRLARALPS